MSTELKGVKAEQIEEATHRTDFALTRFFGGPYGPCVQITQGRRRCIDLTKQEALRMAAALVEFAGGERDVA